MQRFNEHFKQFFNPKIVPCRSEHGNFKIELSQTDVRYFWERKDAREFIKNLTKEI